MHPPVKCFGSCEQSQFYMLLQVWSTADVVMGSEMIGSRTQLLGGICATHFNAECFETATSLQKRSQE